jgi:AhpD family alkylhydroperoxidase
VRNTSEAPLLLSLQRTVNPITLALARSGRGPFSLVRHVGRKTGRTYQTPLILAPTVDGFVAELTFGPTASWYRNIEAAGNCVIVHKGVEYLIDRIEPLPPAAGRRAYGRPVAFFLRLLRRTDFRYLHCASAAAVDANQPESARARIPTIDSRQAPASTRLAYFFTARLLRRLSGNEPDSMLVPVQLYAHLPRLLRAYGQLELATSKLHGLSDRHRALAELKAAAMTNCEYCIDLGSQIARQWGLSDAELLALPTYSTSGLFTPIDKLVLDYATAMSSTPVDVDDQLVQLLAEHFTSAQLVELTHVIALENHRGRFNLALGVSAAGFSQGQVCAIPETATRQLYYRGRTSKQEKES